MQRISTLVFLSGVVVSACGSNADTSVLPYAANLTTVIGSKSAGKKDKEDRSREVSTPDGDDCVDEGKDACAKPQTTCGDNGTADVLVDPQGKSLAIVCYPTDGVAVEEVEGSLSKVGNNTVLVLDDRADGPDVSGDVTLDGNNVTLWGHGPDVSVVGGDLRIDKNNARVRGIRVMGDVTIDKNNPSLIDCVIEGDLVIRGNNVALALCEVWGKTTIEGNNSVLVENFFARAPEIAGKNTVCAGDLAFDDADENGTISDSEWGAELSCEESSSSKP
jgi:hypothetical protein